VNRRAKPGHKYVMCRINVNRRAKPGHKYVMCHINVNRRAKPGHKYAMCHINVNRRAKPRHNKAFGDQSEQISAVLYGRTVLCMECNMADYVS